MRKKPSPLVSSGSLGVARIGLAEVQFDLACRNLSKAQALIAGRPQAQAMSLDVSSTAELGP